MNSTKELQQWLAAPESMRFYIDGPHHGIEAAEQSYRRAYAAAVRESVNLSSLPGTVYGLFRKAQQTREQASVLAAIGRHVPIFSPGHEVDAASHRGRSQGLWHALNAIRGRASLHALHEWSDRVDAWASGDCTEIQVPPPAGRTAS